MDTFDKITNTAKSFSLEKSQKDTIMAAVSKHMQIHPMGQDGGVISPYNAPVVIRGVDVRHNTYNNSWSALFTLSTLKHKKYMPIIIAIMLMLGGGVSLAANNAVPGDALYPIKHVNENIKSTFAVSADANAKVQADIAKERLNEAEKLAAKGDISAEAKADIEANFAEHAAKVKSLIADLEAKGNTKAAAEISANFENSLKAEQNTLLEVSKSDTNDQSALEEINSKVDSFLSGSASTGSDINANASNKNASIDANTSANAQAGVQGSLTSAKNKIAEVENYLSSKKDITATVRAQATAELNIAKTAVVQGEAKLSAKAYSDAQVLFQKAFTSAQKIQSAINASSSTDVNLNLNGSTSINTIKGSTSLNTSSTGSLTTGAGNVSASGAGSVGSKAGL